MNALVNGAPREVAEGSTVARLLQDLGVDASVGIAVAVNARVVRRGAFEEQRLREGDEIEIIRAVSGG